MPTRDDWIRLTAYIEGEGSIYIKPGRNRGGKKVYNALTIDVDNTDPRLPLWCQKTFGGSFRINYSNQRLHKNSKPVATWRIHCKMAEEILKGCLEHFIIKKEQAEIALAYRATFRKRTRSFADNLTPAEIAFRDKCVEDISALKYELPDAAKAFIQ
jgi:hypothetical protein